MDVDTRSDDRQPTLPYPVPTSDAATAVMRANRSSNTKPEVAVRSELHRRGLRFRKNFPVALAGVRTRPDIVFTRRRLAVFVDGCFWHRCPEHGTDPKANSDYWGPKLRRNVERDRTIDQALFTAGWGALRIWEHVSPEQSADAVEDALGRRP